MFPVRQSGDTWTCHRSWHTDERTAAQPLLPGDGWKPRLKQTFGVANLIAASGPQWYSGGMDREGAATYRMSDRRNGDFVPATPAERIGLVWPLTREAASLSKRHDAERRLQRHVASLGRREG